MGSHSPVLMVMMSWVPAFKRMGHSAMLGRAGTVAGQGEAAGGEEEVEVVVGRHLLTMPKVLLLCKVQLPEEHCWNDSVFNQNFQLQCLSVNSSIGHSQQVQALCIRAPRGQERVTAVF
jgi:hypothetical protein